MTGNETYLVLQMLFSRILDPAAFYRVLYEPDGKLKDMIYIDVNPAYEKVMKTTRNSIIGKSFREIWSEREEEWRNLIFQVAQGGVYARHEGWSFDTGKYLHALAFTPLHDVVAVIFLDMTDWKEAEKSLLEKEKLLVAYREKLRDLAAQLSLAEGRTRRDVAVKLHDRIGYSLVSLLNELRSIKTLTASESPSFATLEAAVTEAEKLLQDTRSLTLEISSPLLYEVGLEAALESLAERMLTPHNITFDFRESGPRVKIDVDSRVLIYQMAQELLLNVIKHAKAYHVALRVQRGQKQVRVLVEDNGRGFSFDMDRLSGRQSGIGLFSIRERLHSLGGQLRIISEKGQGCSISLTAPVMMNGECDDANPDSDD
jgi:signal transduction histidine kinase